MKKQLFLVTVLISLLSQAQNNEALKKQFENENIQNNKRFDEYLEKKYGSERSPSEKQEIVHLQKKVYHV